MVPALYVTQHGQQEVWGATSSGLCATSLDVNQYYVHYCALLVAVNWVIGFCPEKNELKNHPCDCGSHSLLNNYNLYFQHSWKGS